MGNRLITILLFVLIGIVGMKAFTIAGISSAPMAQKTAFERVAETRTLRCGYATQPPFININPNSGKMEGGAFKYIMEDIGRRLDLKVEWTEETGYGQIATALQAGRIDAFCGVLWATTIRASAILFSQPLYYAPVYACVPAASTAYDSSTDALNDESITFAGYDGDISTQLARTLFPKAKILTVSPMASLSEWLDQVASGKADAIATCSNVLVSDYQKTNPDKIKLAATQKPLTNIKVVLGLNQGEFELKAMLDQAIFEMTADGTIARIFNEQLGEQVKDLLLPTLP